MYLIVLNDAEGPVMRIFGLQKGEQTSPHLSPIVNKTLYCTESCMNILENFVVPSSMFYRFPLIFIRSISAHFPPSSQARLALYRKEMVT